MCRSDGGVALDVFHRPHPGADGALEIGHRCVALDVDELAGRAGGVGHPPQHQPGAVTAGRRILFAAKGSGPGVESELARRGDGGLAAVAQAARQVEHTVGGADDAHSVERRVGHERAEGVVVAQRAADLAEEMHRRIPAAADEQHVAVQCGRLASRTGDEGVAHAGLTAGAADDGSRSNADAAGGALRRAGAAGTSCGRRRLR